MFARERMVGVMSITVVKAWVVDEAVSVLFVVVEVKGIRGG